MKNRTWNLNLTATDTYPATTIHGVSQDDASRILRGLMHGPPSADYKYVEALALAANSTQGTQVDERQPVAA
jgi:hypothetical protein